MLPNKALIIIGHVGFWAICIAMEIYLSVNPLYIDVLSTMAFSIAFYINYFIVIPLMPKHKPQQGFLLSFALYLLISVSQMYPLYQVADAFFKPLVIIGSATSIGGILHISFFFYAISSLSKLMISKMVRDAKRHEKSISEVDQTIQKIREEINFSFTGSVLAHLKGIADEDPQAVSKPIGDLGKVIRYKLHRQGDLNTMLSDEIKIINQYLNLINQTQQRRFEVLLGDDNWIVKGSALKKVEDFIQTTTQKSGTLMISADEKDIWIAIK